MEETRDLGRSVLSILSIQPAGKLSEHLDIPVF